MWNYTDVNNNNKKKQPIPVAEKSKAKVAVARLMRLRVRIPPGTWTAVSSECSVLSGIRIRDGPITRPEYYQL
jgi:hypothetical protein